ncbi:putative RNA-directed DNA polymerase from transposon BS [Trichonephila inaurata madagascariensis]|uniref:Putative RNA-directed DNA polymerase from transposon BS n=1 Tax=Trichonephila inaurata madagascariensis TaxID=2747483 RepID=A0A8X6WWU6_9ARAC|nr:putative RNA-directed DNA polymerase from transposon BS [Trichonephila inaurata madagascariensis]
MLFVRVTLLLTKFYTSPNVLRHSQNHKPTRHTMAAFLDMSKAFDRVWKYKLSSKLLQNLSRNSPRLRFESSSFLIISGVEKYVNPSQIGLFADDVVLWCSDANISKMEFQLNRSLVNFREFAENHKITSNAPKSTVSLFTTNSHLYNYSSELFLMSERLKYNKYRTYLGFTLDPGWGSDASTLRISYITLVRPVFEYGCQIFQVASPTNLKKLERGQLSAARIITSLRTMFPY